MNFLALTNEVLIRLRETRVSGISANSYATLIAAFINDSKRQVENAWNWEAFNTTIALTTIPNTYEYVLTGSGTRQKSVSVNNITDFGVLRMQKLAYLQYQRQLTLISTGIPEHYAFSGSDGTDTKVTLFPTPNKVSTILFNLYVPQIDLVADTDILLAPSDAVIAGAYARALVERGEDGGLTSGEAYGLYKGILGDRIAIESARSDDIDWIAT